MKFPKFFLEVFKPVLSQQRFIDLVSTHIDVLTARYYPDIKVLIRFNKNYDHYVLIDQYHSYLSDDFIIAKEGLKPCPDQP